jgi:hypothetical protein
LTIHIADMTINENSMQIIIYTYIHTYHSRFIPEGVAEASQILPRIAVRNTVDVTSGKPIAVRLESISGVSAVNPLVAFTTSIVERGSS